jgi:response regulator RpfG family c-di-GMP phosphodiesterase
MDLTCKQCGAIFRASIASPLATAVRVACPSCQFQMVLKPKTAAGDLPLPPRIPRRHIAAIADEPRPFRQFLGDHLRELGFEVAYFETGVPTLDFVRRSRADLVIVNVYLKGMLGVEVTEEIKSDATLDTKVILIGALFRANRFRANPTNLYGADDYIEELIPEKEFRQIIHKLFPDVGEAADETAVEPREYDEARRLARLILSDIIIYHASKVEQGIRDDNFFEVLKSEIEEGRQYYDSRVPMRVRRDSEIYTETLQQFVQMKREELERLRTGTQ